MDCPKCGHKWKDEGRSKGGQRSKRTITPEQQAKMQAARRKPNDQDQGRDAPKEKHGN